tara:strand:+ start:8787 stop:9605 length:819 start_codon:yes stop_codon:yes gene_type:complete
MFSVLMSVYAAEDPLNLEAALSSVWDSQSLKPSEIVLVKDGPLGSPLNGVIQRWMDKLRTNLKVVSLEFNVGLANALNVGIEHCSFELVARMDSDDISYPDRFKRQVEFMTCNPSIVASSGNIDEWDPELNRVVGARIVPKGGRSLRKYAKFRSPLSHPATIFRKSVIQDSGGYPSLNNAQDYALWSLLLASGYELANLSDKLLRMRVGEGFIERRGKGYFLQELKLLRYQLNIGFLSRPQFLLNVVIKAVLRLSPNRAKVLFYKYARGGST